MNIDEYKLGWINGFIIGFLFGGLIIYIFTIKSLSNKINNVLNLFGIDKFLNNANNIINTNQSNYQNKSEESSESNEGNNPNDLFLKGIAVALPYIMNKKTKTSSRSIKKNIV